MNMHQKFIMHSNVLFIAAIAAYTIGILLIICPKKLLKSRGIISPKRIKTARIFGIAVIIGIDILIVAMWAMGII